MVSGTRRLFQPLLAGATSRDRILACFGAAIGVLMVALAGQLLDGPVHAEAWIVAPVGASAVLLFAVPASPLTQPWPVVGGSVLSAAVGLTVGAVIGSDAIAVGLAVGLAIAVMSLARCLHPPGGAAAITAVLGVPVGETPDILFPLLPVGIDALAIVLLAWAFHRLVTRHSYPHVAPQPVVGGPIEAGHSMAGQVRFGAQDVDAVLARIGDSYDISREDLGAILRAVESEALTREYGDLTCGEIMSGEVNAVGIDADVGDAVRLLVDSGARLLPVLDADGGVVGGVGLRNLSTADITVKDAMVQVPTTSPESLAIDLSEPLAGGNFQAVIVVDEDHRPLGLITPSALLAAITK